MARRSATGPAGSLGHLASFSFQSSKNLTAGEGGIITTNDDALAESCRSIQNCGRVPDGDLVRASRHLGQLSAGRIPGCPAELPARSAGGSDRGRATQRPVSRAASCHRCRAFIRKASSPTARGTAITCSCCGSTRRLSARRATPCSSRSRPRAFPARPATVFRCPISRCSATRPLVRICAGVRTAGLLAARCPNSDRSAPSSASGSNRLLLGTRDDMDDIGRAFEKIYEHRQALNTRDLPI